MTGYIKDEIINEIFDRTKDIIESTSEYKFTAKIMRLNFIMTTIYERIEQSLEPGKAGGIPGYSKEQHKKMKNWGFKVKNGKICGTKNEKSKSFQPFFDLNKDQFRFFDTKEEFSRDKIQKCIYEENRARDGGSEIDDDLIDKVCEKPEYEFNAILSCLRNGLAHGMYSISSNYDKIRHNQEKSTVVPIDSNAPGIITELIIVSKNKCTQKQSVILMDESALDKFCDCFQNYLNIYSNNGSINLVEKSDIQIEKKIIGSSI